jgi:hypothetical protein
MQLKRGKYLIFLLVAVICTAIGLSSLWHVPYIFTLIGFSGWALVGHIVTADDDLPGGWSNPFGELPFPWRELLLKALVFIGLCVIAAFSSTIRNYGGHP